MLFSDKDIAEASLYEFFKQSWHVIEGHTEFVDEWYLKEISKSLEDCYHRKIKNLLINLPPRKGKTNLISIAFPVWVWLHNPEEKFICASYTNSLALKISDKSRTLIESEWFKDNWGDRFKLRRDQNSKSYFANNKTGYRISTSAGSFITGSGGDIIICIPSHTMIQCDKGVFTIGDIVDNKLDVKVLSYNHKFNTTEFKSIDQYHKHVGKELYEIEFDDGSVLECTEEHPVFVENKGYVNAKELREGDTCLSNL